MSSSVEMELRKFVAPEFIFGVGARFLCGKYARNLGIRKILIVSDPGVIQAGWCKDVIHSLEQERLAYSIYSKVSPNPRAEEVMEGAEYYNSNTCNGIIAVGGGSVIDCAKGIGTVSTNHQSILEFEGVDRVLAPTPPLVCIPTTGGTSADVSQFAIISDPQRHVKFAIISKAVVPDVSLIDPQTLTSMDAYLTACTGMDALSHAIEAFVSSAHSYLTDLHALEAIRLIRTALLPSIADPQNVLLRDQIMRGSLLAGLAFSNASLGGVHAMAHSLGGLKDLPHGECNALLLDHVIAYNFPEASERFEAIANALGMCLKGQTLHGKKSAILGEISRLRAEAGISGTLKKKGIRTSDIPDLAKNSMKDPCIVTNPRRPKQRDIEVIFEEAL